MRFKTIKILIVLCMVTGLALASTITVHAGGINGNESRVIGAASGTFMYEGSPYVATSSSIGSLTSYLSGDGIDLTASQASRAISMMYSSVREGVEGGYLVYAGSGPLPDINNPEVIEEGEVPDPTDDEDNEGRLIAKHPGTVKVYDGESMIKVVSAERGTVYTAEIPVKNTGFSLTGSLMFVVALGVVLAGCAVVIVRFKLLADEE